MAKDSERDVLTEAQSMGKVVSGLDELPSRIDKAKFQKLTTRMADHLGDIDDLKKKLAAAVNAKDADLKGLRSMIADIRTAVKGAYGADSTEYELVGGTRASERKKPSRKSAK
jgi:hypothetical protein